MSEEADPYTDADDAYALRVENCRLRAKVEELDGMWRAAAKGGEAENRSLRADKAELVAALEAVIPAVAWGVGDIPISEYPTITDTKRALANARAVLAKAKEKP